MCSPGITREPTGQICAAEASVVKKPSIAGEMSVGMGIWRDNRANAATLASWARCHDSHVWLMCHIRGLMFSPIMSLGESQRQSTDPLLAYGPESAVSREIGQSRESDGRPCYSRHIRPATKKIGLAVPEKAVK